MLEYLQRRGMGVCDGPFGKNLGEGLFELRLDQAPDELDRRAGRSVSLAARREKILLRVFCHAHGEKIVLLLGGYDKLAHSAKSYQQRQIAEARKRLVRWKEMRKRSGLTG